MNYYQKPVEEIITELTTDVHAGLSDAESTARLYQYGYNLIKRTYKRNVLQVFLEQFKNMPVMLLIVAAAISFF